MDWNKDVSKIATPIGIFLILAYSGFNYYQNYKVNKFINMYTEQGIVIKEIFLKASENIKSYNDNYIDENDYNSIKKITNDMINNGCPLVSANKICKKINVKLLDIIENLKSNTDDPSIILEYLDDIELYKIFLKSDGIIFE